VVGFHHLAVPVLPATTKSLTRREPAGAVGAIDHALQQPVSSLRDPGRDNAMERLRRMRQQRLAGGVVGGLQPHYGRHQIPAIGDRRVGDRELDRRDSHALAET